MTTPRDPDALLAAYLADGMEVLPDRVVDAVLDEVHRTHQRAVFGPWRTRSMFKTALGAAAVFAVLIVGATFVLFGRGQPAVVGGPSQTPAIASPVLGANARPSVDPSPTVVPPRAASWTPTGGMIGARWGGTAVLLQDGNVLVVGGNSAPWPPDAEVYDPRTGMWTVTAPMIAPRMQFAATRLLDGRVLVLGGAGDPGVLASAELYDPSTGTWTATGKLHTARYNTTATLLPDGKVLVAGGDSSQNGSLASAELYDPSTGSWTPTGSMRTARNLQTTTLLGNGTVLVAGGSYDSVINDNADPSRRLGTAELYDPGTGKWTPTGDMTEVRSSPTATRLLDGRVLVVAGAGDAGVLASAELYDASTGTWTATGSPVTPLMGSSATLLADGRVLVTGGVVRQCGPGSASAELYDPITGSWGATTDMIQGRVAHTATLLPDGRVLAAGGTGTPGGGIPCDTAAGQLSSADLYDPGTGE